MIEGATVAVVESGLERKSEEMEYARWGQDEEAKDPLACLGKRYKYVPELNAMGRTECSGQSYGPRPKDKSGVVYDELSDTDKKKIRRIRTGVSTP